MSFENWTIEDLLERCTDYDDMTLEMDKEEFAALRRMIGKLKSPAPDAWIPCSERMPDDDTYVVAADIGHGEIYSAFAAWFIHGRFSVMEGLSASNYDGGAMIEINMPITHWQPLPAPPKEI